ncbi:amino acid adenylation domain-containing protein [Paenibacillus sp. SYP-B3998]|uniref:Amino acid adenylation domain-containing protein n=1 Tax=Paenibacillus sp. SYP-B3998 TaxID=2678564 RepID=A0A6G3ZZ09_9BACL|nr:amino acid adenylation domain-containing protein [Paenibacillus sp. SYP-B3998]NEW06819.1 amino acid adenylation domain-containing protein [Paenibacillus sp. SYP-B3998]
MTRWPLTNSQKRIWYTENIYPNSNIHNVSIGMHFKGSIDFITLEQSISIIIKKHPGIRTQVGQSNNEPYQYVIEQQIPIDFIDFSKQDQAEEAFDAWVKKEMAKPFRLEHAPLYSMTMFRISDVKTGFFYRFHHLIADGKSLTQIVVDQIVEIYMKLTAGEQVNEEVEFSYLDYIEKEQEYLESKRFVKSKQFWFDKFAQLPEIFPIRSDFMISNRKRFKISLEQTERIKQFTDLNKVSINTFFVGTMLLYLNKLVQQNDLVINTPVINRSGHKEKNMFGMFTSTMPLRIYIDEKQSILLLLQSVQKELMSCYVHQKYPYNFLHQDLQLKKKGIDSLYEVIVNYMGTHPPMEVNGVPLEIVEYTSEKQSQSLQFIIKEWATEDSFLLEYDYKTDLFTDEEINFMHNRLLFLMDIMMLNDSKPISDLSLVDEEEKRSLIYEMNQTDADYPLNKSISQLFEEQVTKTPGRMALSYDQQTLSYEKLNEKANQVAWELLQRGMQPEQRVGILSEPSLEMMIAILGVLKAGCAYVPISTTYPKERIDYIVRDSALEMIISTKEKFEIAGYSGKWLVVEDALQKAEFVDNPAITVCPEHLSYVIYTSGTTGYPKGVMIENRNVVNLVCSLLETIYQNDNQPLHIALLAPFVFDASVQQMFAALLGGYHLHIVPEEVRVDGRQLLAFYNHNKIDVSDGTPAHIKLLINDKFTRGQQINVKHFIIGGEQLSSDVIRTFYAHFQMEQTQITNIYGPTECCVDVTSYSVSRESLDQYTILPIGTPLQNSSLYIMNKKMQLTGIDEVGEICISGANVGRGYLNQPELTEAAFIPNPFISGQRMYKTGDLGRRKKNGIVEILGRSDDQVKIRGYRIEIGEIEAQIRRFPSVKEAVVMARSENHGDRYLCGYYVANNRIETNELRTHLSRILPDYMVPSYFVQLESIPLTQNGKLNRNELPEPNLNRVAFDAFAPPETEKEIILAGVWTKVLGSGTVGRCDNFYALGGDSIKAIQIAYKIQDSGFSIKVAEMLSNPILMDMSKAMKANESGNHQGYLQGDVPLMSSTAQFLSYALAKPHMAVESIGLDLKNNEVTHVIGQILTELVRHHDSLRLVMDVERNRFSYDNRYINDELEPEVIDLSNVHADNLEEQIELHTKRIHSMIQMNGSPLFIGCVFDLGIQGKRLLLAAHGLIIDKPSWEIIIGDFAKRLESIHLGMPFALTPKTRSYKEWVLKHSELPMKDGAINRDPEQEQEYPESTTGFSIVKDFSTLHTEWLLSKANEGYNTEPEELLAMSIAFAVNDMFDVNKMSVVLEMDGRKDQVGQLDVSRTVGHFTSYYPVRIHYPNESISNRIKASKEQLRFAFSSSSLTLSKQHDICLQRIRNWDNKLSTPWVTLSKKGRHREVSELNPVTDSIDMTPIVEERALRVIFTSNHTRFTEDTVTKLAELFAHYLIQIMEHCLSLNHVEYTPSDFDSADISQEDIEHLFSL